MQILKKTYRFDINHCSPIKNVFSAIYMIFFILIVSAPPLASASEIKSLDAFDDWQTSVFIESARKTCFMKSAPFTYVPSQKNRHGDVMLYITHFPGKGAKNEVSIMVGYKWKAEASITLQIGTKKFPMFSQDKLAWLIDTRQLPAAINAMRRGSKAKIMGQSIKGTKTEYTFSLKGFSAAHKAINTYCKVPKI